MTLDERLKRLEKKINNENFRKNKGTSNEVSYYIFDYPAEKEMKIRKYLGNLERKNKTIAQGYELKIYDFYDIMIDLLEEEGLIEECIKMEEIDGIDYLSEAISDLFKMNTSANYFNTYIEENTPDNSVVFIMGVGKIYPFLRAHGILNELHLVFDKAPVVLFYPGEYNGQSLVLFSEIKDNNYYRAFPL